MNKILIMSSVALAFGLAGCDPSQSSSDQVQKRQQEQLSQQSNMAVGMPAITEFAEKRMMNRRLL